MGGNSFNFAANHESTLIQNFNQVVATSMTDLCGLFGLFPHLAQIPNSLYFHENQMAYPASKDQPDVLHYQLNSIKSAMTAKQLIFNSIYNKNSFLTGVKKIEQLVPDGFPKQLYKLLESKSHVIPVPLSEDCFNHKLKSNKQPRPLTITWNHRWEYDKGPETLLQVIALCQKELPDIRFNVIGQQFRQSPDVFKAIQTKYGQLIKHWGYIERRTDYLNVLSRSDIILSTALHEFQGLAVMEAVAQGCVPLLPDRLAYPNFYAKDYLYQGTLNNPKKEAIRIVEQLKRWQKNLPQAPDMSCFSWAQMKHQYQDIIINN